MRQHRVREEEGFFFQEIDNEKLNTKDFSLHLINMGKRRLPAKKKTGCDYERQTLSTSTY